MNKIAQVVQEGRFVNVYLNGKDITKEDKNYKKLELEVKTLKDHKCYACGQEMHDAKHEEVLADKQKSLEDAIASYAAAEKLLLELGDAKSALGTLGTAPTVYYDKEEDAIQHRANLANLETQLTAKLAEVDPYVEQIEDMQNQALQEINYDTLNELTRLQEHQDFLLKLLTSKDSFIRKKIIEQNLSYLNARLTHYLDRVGLPHTVVFQNDLTVSIEELGRELDFDNLSRGERNRLILSMSWAFRDVWESL